MASPTSVINPGGDYEETIQRLAKHLGRDKNRRAVFNLIYGRGSKPRSKKQIAEALSVSGTAQVVQNSLDDLAKHHLIVRVENKSLVKDGSRWVYAKNEFVRANRKRIIGYADNPAKAKALTTKRTPQFGLGVRFIKPSAPKQRRQRQARASAGSNAKLRIVLLVTNPERAASLQTGLEARDIQKEVYASKNRDDIELKVSLAPTLDDLINELNGFKPHIVHFSGHGGGRSLLFDNHRPGDDGGVVLDFDMIARLIGTIRARPDLLVLAACDTVDGAEELVTAVPAVIAMAASIDDEAACEFSARLYRSLGDGASIGGALTQAKLKLEHKGYRDASLPTLLVGKDSTRDRSFFSP